MPPAPPAARYQVAFRIPPELSAFLDAEVARLREERGPDANLSIVIREILFKAMKAAAGKRKRGGMMGPDK